jgi:uncharacterized membrane protein YebE (DUF533 family)
MRRLIGMAALAGVGMLAYREMRKRQRQGREPKAPTVRDAGPEAMRDQPRRWSRTDERADESFPASDPPSTY